MKRIFLVLIVGITLLTACEKVVEKPKLKTIQSVKVSKLDKKRMNLSAEAVLENPNPVGLDISGIDLDVSIDGTKIGKITHTKNFTINAGDEFILPLNIEFSPKEILKKSPRGVFAAITGSKVKVNYKGTVDAGKWGKSLTLDVDETSDVKLNLFGNKK